MPRYSARCISAAGDRFSLELEAANVAALRRFIESRQGFLVSQKEIQAHQRGRRIRIPTEAQAQLFNLLALQLANGVHTDMAIAKLRDEFPDRRVRIVLEGLHSQLSTARSALSEAMRLFPRCFSEGTIAAVRVGEQGGAARLAERFADLRDQLRFRQRIRRAAIRAVAYPAFILCFATAVVALLLVKLVPLVEELLAGLNVPLPPVTLGILATSAFLRHQGGWLLAGVTLAVVACQLCRAWPPTALAIDRLLLRLPLTGRIFMALVTAEIARTYQALYSAGAAAPEALNACAEVVSNRALRAALLRARRSLETGELTASKPEAPAITEALRSTGYLPEMALTIISTGETSGGLTRAFNTVAEHYSQEAHEQIAVFFALFEKALMLALILTVGLVILGIWQPIMTAAQHVH